MHKFYEYILRKVWQQRGLISYLLSPFSLAFIAIVSVRRFLYNVGIRTSTCLPVPVIVIGNIFIGGTGKTPFTIWLVQVLRQAG